jgi:hypothetical protein
MQPEAPRGGDSENYDVGSVKLPVEPLIPDTSTGRCQMKCSPWSSRFRVGRGANDTTPEQLTATKPSKTPRPTQGCKVVPVLNEYSTTP